MILEHSKIKKKHNLSQKLSYSTVQSNSHDNFAAVIVHCKCVFRLDYLGKKRYISAVVFIKNSIIAAAVTNPEERGVSQVHAIQHNGSNGKDPTSNIHENREAHLRGDI